MAYDYTITVAMLWHPLLGWIFAALGMLLAAKIVLAIVG